MCSPHWVTEGLLSQSLAATSDTRMAAGNPSQLPAYCRGEKPHPGKSFPRSWGLPFSLLPSALLGHSRRSPAEPPHPRSRRLSALKSASNPFPPPLPGATTL